MTPEHKLMNEVRIEMSKRQCLSFRMNVGLYYSMSGDLTQSGLPKGFPDLMILRPDGVACFIETKIHPRKPTPEQLNMQKALRGRGYKSGTAYTVQEAVAIVFD